MEGSVMAKDSLRGGVEATSDDQGEVPYIASVVDDFDQFYRAQYPSLVAFAYSLCHDWAVAEEVAQEAFVAAHRNWDRIKYYDLPAGWVRRVAGNHCASHVRRKIAEAKATFRATSGRRRHSEAPEPPDHALWAAVSDLPSRQAQIIALHFVAGHSFEEISELLDLAPSTVRVHMLRAKRALATRLDLETEEGSHADS